MIPFLLGLVGLVLLVAAPIMIFQGLLGRRSVTRELVQQRISFPPSGLPAALGAYAGRPVRTGIEARAYSDLIADHVVAATGGRTYAEIAAECQKNKTDESLSRLRETAFMGETLRGALLGAYQAWQVTLLVIGLGLLCAAMGAGFLAMALQ
ncbi:hypothetical protein [Actinoplanes couchii]|uniref:Type II secretion system protein n=1 Tax=Actinoplanes couchii TaxID=403638 RepID=A0ABQ3XHT6_9ACTN|nr:hypothetical protein [Actinoplanes couchii]MDR6317659.1 hypothetical protein [Actinoplanes couchii]GID58044.1 hypothetical protein Aco03nite_064480 [Actinoplanes couchii]